jgi:hypothetical protein
MARSSNSLTMSSETSCDQPSAVLKAIAASAINADAFGINPGVPVGHANPVLYLYASSPVMREAAN